MSGAAYNPSVEVMSRERVVPYIENWPSEGAQVYQVALADPESSDGRGLLAALSETLQQITGSSGTASFDVSDVKVERACFAIARSAGGAAVGCGALRPLQPGVAELKRMFATPGSNGAGSAVLAFLERQASEFGYGQVWLETRQVNVRAVAFYRRHGYRTIASFGRYVGRPEALCLGKHLPPLQPLVAEPQQPSYASVQVRRISPTESRK